MRRRIVVGSAVLAALALVLGTALASRRDNGAVRTVPIGHAPGGLLLDSRTGHIFVSNAADNTVDTIRRAHERPRARRGHRFQPADVHARPAHGTRPRA